MDVFHHNPKRKRGGSLIAVRPRLRFGLKLRPFGIANLTCIGSSTEVYVVITKELAPVDQGTESE
ncbi:MAG: hypothetical protein ACKVH8_12690 [Pirellulales bacterium]